MLREPGSFRDPSGYVFRDATGIVRTINASYAEEWEYISRSGLLREAVDKGLVVGFEEMEAGDLPPEISPDVSRHGAAWKALRVTTLPFISYPYEWCFSQLRDAALLTLDLHLLALEHGCVLKDATAFNVQFFDGKPVFIDLLSFERWKEGQPWQAYGQFCSHFVAPLALMAKTDIHCGAFSRLYCGGLPLDLACKLLPFSARLSPGLFMHLFLHARMQNKHADGRAAREKVNKATLSKTGMREIAESLRRLVASLVLPKQTTEWSEYYTDTNYTPAGMEGKKALIARLAAEYSGDLALDIGANTGEFSRIAAEHFTTTIAADIDPLAVERHYASHPGPRLVPLILDLTNPTPAIGWRNTERSTFAERCRADFIMALAVAHHLVITGGIPLPLVAAGFADLLKEGGVAVVEFVPKEDSQVRRLLAARDDIFTEYSEEHCVAAFQEAGFSRLARFGIPDSCRTLHVFRKIMM